MDNVRSGQSPTSVSYEITRRNIKAEDRNAQVWVCVLYIYLKYYLKQKTKHLKEMGIEHSQDENDADNDQVSILSSRGAVLVLLLLLF